MKYFYIRIIARYNTLPSMPSMAQKWRQYKLRVVTSWHVPIMSREIMTKHSNITTRPLNLRLMATYYLILVWGRCILYDRIMKMLGNNMYMYKNMFGHSTCTSMASSVLYYTLIFVVTCRYNSYG